MNYTTEIIEQDKVEMLTQSYIHKEFFIFCLPSYFIIVASLIRIYGFYKQDKEAELHQDEETYGYQWQPDVKTKLTTSILILKISISFHLKIYITAWIGLIYFITFLASYNQSLVSFPVPENYSFLYLIMLLGQLISFILLKQESQRGEDQSINSLRLFWPFQASFFFVRILQSYMSFTFAILDFAQLAPSTLLLLYGLYKPKDNDEKIEDEEVPGFAKDIFQFIEHNQTIKRILSQKPNLEKLVELEPVQRFSQAFIRSPEREDTTYKEFTKILNQNVTERPSIYDQESFLLTKLPKRAILISKKVTKRFKNENESEILYFYQIITQIDQSHYIVERRYPEFLDLEKVQKNIYSNFKPEVLPTLLKIDLRVNEEEYQYIQRRAEVLELWLKEQFKEPIFISLQLLQFLGVEDQHQGQFLTYSQLILQRKEKQFKTPVSFLKPKESIQSQFVRESMKYQGSQSVIQVDNYIAQNMQDLNFSSYCNSFEYGMFGANSVEFVINITHMNTSGKEYQYRILRTLSSIKEFTKILEIQLGRTLPASMTHNLKDKSNQQKMQFVDYFFKNLLSNQEFFCTQLFEFINFDVKSKVEIVRDLGDHYTTSSP